MSIPTIAVLGAGPAGLGAALRLRRQGKARVIVLERGADVGGNAGSFELAGMQVDFGSHRLHPSCDPEILADIRAMLGPSLLDRRRHGRIRLLGRWIHFPLKPVDLALRLPPSFAIGSAADMLRRSRSADAPGTEDSFASVLEQRLGRRIAHDFYLPYARKIWGLPPEELSPVQARKRVSADSFGKLAAKVLAAVPGLGKPGAGRFFYPRDGFGSISRGYAQAATAAGADIRLRATVRRVATSHGKAVGLTYERDGRSESIHTDFVWSTIPLTVLARGIEPAAPADVLEACGTIEYRSMLLVYLVLGQARFSEYDAHYLPQADVPITRISEPKNYSARSQPSDATVLCAELPCAQSDRVWTMDDGELGTLVAEGMAAVGLPIRARIATVVSRRLPQAYPIYRRGYEPAFERIDGFLTSLENLLSFGRQGLFAHDNTHHTLQMAYRACDCLGTDGTFDHRRWREHRREFESHVVED